MVVLLRTFEEGADQLMAAPSGCLYVPVLTERQLVQARTRDQIANAVVAWRAAPSNPLGEALTSHPAGPAVDTAALARHFFVTFRARSSWPGQ